MREFLVVFTKAIAVDAVSDGQAVIKATDKLLRSLRPHDIVVVALSEDAKADKVKVSKK